MTETALNNKLRSDWTKILVEILTERGEDVMLIKDNILCFPCVDDDGNDKWVRIPIEVPKGTKTDPFDGYALHDDYEFSKAEKAKKAAEAAEKKAKKIAADKKYREEKAKIDKKIEERRGAVN